MAAKKSHHRQAPWKAVTLGLLGISIGYIAVVYFTQGSAAFAGAVKCPVPKQVCATGDCSRHPACASGACSNDCPGNCPHHA